MGLLIINYAPSPWSSEAFRKFGVRRLVAAFGRRFCRRRMTQGVPLSWAAERGLLWRQVAKAAEAETSLRTPNSCRCYQRCSPIHPCPAHLLDSAGWFFDIG